MVQKVKSKSLIYNIIIFILILLLSLVLFYILQAFIPLEKPIVALFNALGYVDVNGATIINNTIIMIDYQCSGFFSIFVYLALIFSPITLLSLKKKFIWAFLGIIILYITNILRLILLFELSVFIGVDNMHIIGWFLMSIVILSMWYFITRNKSSNK